MCVSALIGAGGGLLSGMMGKKASKEAAQAQQAAAMMQAQIQKEVYDETTQRFEPFYEGGTKANDALLFELGLGPRPTFGGNQLTVETVPGQTNNQDSRFDAYAAAVQSGDPYNMGNIMAGLASPTPGGYRRPQQGGGGTTPTQYSVGGKMFSTMEEAQAYADANSTAGTEYGGFKATPAYDFRMSEGLNAIDNSAASRGNAFSGATMKAAQGYGEGLAASEYDNFLRRLTGMAGSGQAAAGNQANAGANYAAGAGQALGNFGNAGAAGAIGGANAMMGGWNTGLGLFNYMNTLNSGPSAAQANNMLNQSNIFSTGAGFM